MSSRSVFLLVVTVVAALAGAGCDECGPGGDGGEGGDGSGGAGAAGTGGAASTLTPPTPGDGDCAVDDDCEGYPFTTMNPQCAMAHCREGRCSIEVFTPPYTCGSPDPDGPSGPWVSDDPSVGQCYGGQCCFGCIYDLGSNPSELDPSDGPCLPGHSDDFCGAAGQLCLNCKIMGLVCVHGACTDPS